MLTSPPRGNASIVYPPLPLCYIPRESQHRITSYNVCYTKLLRELRGRMSGGSEEDRVFPARDRVFGDGEGIHPDAVDRLLVVAAGFASHEEGARGDRDEIGLDFGCMHVLLLSLFRSPGSVVV